MNNRFLAALLVFGVALPAFAEAATPVTRRDGFLLLWQGIKRPAPEISVRDYTDVPVGSIGYFEINFGKGRKLLPQEELFHPDDSLTLGDALLWLFRTRNVEPVDLETGDGLSEIADPEDIPMLLERYPLISFDPVRVLTAEELSSLAANLDAKLIAEDHEVSLYSEKFHGDGTAFGEKFNMYDLTAAHRTYPYNTLVKVTNPSNGKSVIVRINDRGPFVVGRDMDLSLAAFLTIEERSKGKTRATFERLGDVSLVSQTCVDERAARRISSKVILDKGVPRSMGAGEKLTLSANSFFAIETITHPNGSVDLLRQWITPSSDRTQKEVFEFTPVDTGTYMFLFRTREGVRRTMSMQVTSCAAVQH